MEPKKPPERIHDLGSLGLPPQALQSRLHRRPPVCVPQLRPPLCLSDELGTGKFTVRNGEVHHFRAPSNHPSGASSTSLSLNRWSTGRHCAWFSMTGSAVRDPSHFVLGPSFMALRFTVVLVTTGGFSCLPISNDQL